MATAALVELALRVRYNEGSAAHLKMFQELSSDPNTTLNSILRLSALSCAVTSGSIFSRVSP